jgi:hypothetical protein
VQHLARKVRGLRQGWIANDVYIGETGNAECVAEARASCAFEVGQDFEAPGDAVAGIERLDVRGGVSFFRTEAVRTGVFGVEGGLLLANYVDLG